MLFILEIARIGFHCDHSPPRDHFRRILARKDLSYDPEIGQHALLRLILKVSEVRRDYLEGRLCKSGYTKWIGCEERLVSFSTNYKLRKQLQRIRTRRLRVGSPNIGRT